MFLMNKVIVPPFPHPTARTGLSSCSCTKGNPVVFFFFLVPFNRLHSWLFSIVKYLGEKVNANLVGSIQYKFYSISTISTYPRLQHDCTNFPKFSLLSFSLSPTQTCLPSPSSHDSLKPPNFTSWSLVSSCAAI